MWILLSGASWAFAPVSFSAGVGTTQSSTSLGVHQDLVEAADGGVLEVGRGEGLWFAGELAVRLPLGSRWELSAGVGSWAQRTSLPMASIHDGEEPPPRVALGDIDAALVQIGPRVGLHARGPWLLPWLGIYASAEAG
ncbi:MAG: hypothetical protein GY884_34795 [Proteobacteria bacterium]|nr:hypothetical protein [Pseudomonadota bacterium]